MAVIRWGEPRTTRDAGFSLLTGFGDEELFLQVLVTHFSGREPDEDQFALRNRVYRAFASNGTDIDVALAGLLFEKEMIARSSEYDFRPDCRLRTCAAEDLLVMKAYAGRDQDWADVRNVMTSRWEALDWNLVERNLGEICELGENFTSVPKFDSIREELRILHSRKKR